MYLTEVLIGSCMMFAILDAVLCPVVTAVDKLLVAIHTHGRPGTSPSLFAITAFGDAMEVKLALRDKNKYRLVYSCELRGPSQCSFSKIVST